MSDFLNFLNTADHDTLKKISGISSALADHIIAARPFDATDDLLLVHGMGKNLLSRMQSFAEAQETEPESSAMIPVEEEAQPAQLEVIEKSQPAPEAPVKDKPSFWSRLGQAFLVFVRALFRLIATVLVIGGIGAAIYFGVPFINNNIVVPIQKNTSQIRQLEVELAAQQARLDETSARVGELEKNIEAHTASITKLEQMQSMLEQEISDQNNSVMVALKREIMLTRSIETVARARLFLSQSNFGLARDDVQAARDILAELLIDAPSYQVTSINQIIMRLDFALSNLPAFPVIAVDDVDIVWELLMMGLPESETDIVATFTFTPTPAPILTFTPTPEAIPTSTP